MLLSLVLFALLREHFELILLYYKFSICFDSLDDLLKVDAKKPIFKMDFTLSQKQPLNMLY